MFRKPARLENCGLAHIFFRLVRRLDSDVFFYLFLDSAEPREFLHLGGVKVRVGHGGTVKLTVVELVFVELSCWWN